MKKMKLFVRLLIVLVSFHTSLSAQEFGSWNVPIPDFDSWWKPVENFIPIASKEHPRLLFRKDQLPSLRQKMQTPEGKSILQRLRFLLDGKEGKGMPIAFNPAKKAYADGEWDNSVVDTAGVYTFGHTAGYGLLYQLTGELEYAELGKKCFELALDGQRDRDDRYSWVDPGGALRAGTVLGWMAVGYDLCYDGWDKATREKLGKAIESYSTGSFQKYGQVMRNLESMTGGTMPPKSNHYGMQVGGAALALLSITKEPWVNQERLDSLLKVNSHSMVHNVTQGFGDGGFYTEGDGTGSMATYITYLTALQAWQNVKGMDFANVDRPNVRMTALKWLYLTLFEEDKPMIWPIRGAYPHNVWSRSGISGAGYFSLPFGILEAKYTVALKWFYEAFLLKPDMQMGIPYEPSKYPHLPVCAFVNWPIELAPKNPALVLPHCYRDSHHGFYAWRNRWQDVDDIIITALTEPTRGFHGAKADSTFYVVAYGQKSTWGKFSGRVTQWETSNNGATSSMRFENGLVVGIDLSGKSGADVMLLANEQFEGKVINIGDQVITVKFLTEQKPPKVNVLGNHIQIGEQKIAIAEGEFDFLQQ